MTIAELYPRYFDEIRRFVRSMSRDDALSEDVAQETFMRALKSNETICALSEVKVRSWLYTTARRIFIDQYRREKNRPSVEEPDFFEEDLSGVVVNDLLSALSPEERTIFALRHFASQTSGEIASRLGIPPATVRTRLRAAVKKLRKLYEQSREG